MKKKPTAKVINIPDIKSAINMNGFLGTVIASSAMRVLGLCKINSLYSEFAQYEGEEFTQALLKTFNIKYDIIDSQLNYIPQDGPFIIVSNHPFGGADGVVLFNVIASLRPDFKILTNFILSHIPNLKNNFLPVNPFSDEGGGKSSISGLKAALLHVKNGGCLGIFPAGEVSTYYNGKKYSQDKEWGGSIIKLLSSVNVPIVPIYFDGENSKIFHFLGRIHPMLRTVRLMRELLNKIDTTVTMRIGKPVSISELNEFSNLNELASYLKNRCYALEGELQNINKCNDLSQKYKEAIALPKNKKGIIKEIHKLEKESLLFTVSNYQCFLASYDDIPEIMWQLGRKREESFRAIGEGTNNAIDIDEFDKYYKHLILWNTHKKEIAGAYRLGIGEEIMEEIGVSGFYSRTLFKYSPKLNNILAESIELGRSFVSVEYQKEALPLMLLIKGLLYTVMKYPNCKYLFGPVSISSWYPNFYRSLIIYYLKQKHSNNQIGQFIKPIAPFTPNFLRVNPKDLLNNKTDSIEKFDRYLMKISDNQYRLPTLIKKYLKLHSSIIDFNVDKDFNYCVDGLVFLNIYDIPKEELVSLSKGCDDINSILDRFGYGTGS